MPRSGHIALAGRPNVGKSSLLNTLVGEHLALVSPKAQATRLPVTGLRTDGDIQFVFHDLPGLLDPEYAMQARMRALALDGVERAAGVMAARLGWPDDRVPREVAAYERELRETLVPVDAL